MDGKDWLLKAALEKFNVNPELVKNILIAAQSIPVAVGQINQNLQEINTTLKDHTARLQSLQGILIPDYVPDDAPLVTQALILSKEKGISEKEAFDHLARHNFDHQKFIA